MNTFRRICQGFPNPHGRNHSQHLKAKRPSGPDSFGLLLRLTKLLWPTVRQSTIPKVAQTAGQVSKWLHLLDMTRNVRDDSSKRLVIAYKIVLVIRIQIRAYHHDIVRMLITDRNADITLLSARLIKHNDQALHSRLTTGLMGN